MSTISKSLGSGTRAACLLPALALAACTDETLTDPAPLGPPQTGEASVEQRGTARSVTAIHLGSLGGETTSALGINNRGQVVGTSEDADGIQRAFLWTPDEGMRDLGGLSDGPAAALAINQAGEIVGWSHTEEGEQVATRWRVSGEIERLPHTDAGGPDSPASAVAINARGDAVGFTHGDISALWPAGGGVEVVCGARGFPSGIADDGTVVGIASTIVGGFLRHVDPFAEAEYSGFIRTPRDTDCRGLIDEDFVAQEATAINNRGQVVGWGGEWKPVAVGIFELLTSFVPYVYSDRAGFRTGSQLPERPLAINNRGTVVGDEVTAINDAGDHVGGAVLWTTRPNRFRDRSAVGAMADGPSTAATARGVSAEGPGGQEDCRGVLAPLRGEDAIGVEVGKVLGASKVSKHFRYEITPESFTFERDEASIAQESALDGIYVIRTSVSEDDLEAEAVVRAYKNLSQVEQAFRVSKDFALEVEPIRHRKDERVRAHVFPCMLAFYVYKHMETALAPILFTDHDPEGAHGAEPMGEITQYEDKYRLCYIRGPEGIIVALAQQL